MKTEELKAAGLTEEQVGKVMAANGKDVEAEKAKTAALAAERDGLKAQLAEAGKTIEGFKGVDAAGMQKQIDEWKQKAQAAEENAKKQAADFAYDAAVQQYVGGLTFTSELAKTAFASGLKAKIGRAHV